MGERAGRPGPGRVPEQDALALLCEGPTEGEAADQRAAAEARSVVDSNLLSKQPQGLPKGSATHVGVVAASLCKLEGCTEGTPSKQSFASTAGCVFTNTSPTAPEIIIIRVRSTATRIGFWFSFRDKTTPRSCRLNDTGIGSTRLHTALCGCGVRLTQHVICCVQFGNLYFSNDL